MNARRRFSTGFLEAHRVSFLDADDAPAL